LSAKILLVEDDTDLSQIYTLVLTKIGYSVTLAENGAVGLEVASREIFDLIITDRMMPIMDGNQLIKELSKMPNPPPVIMLTAALGEIEPNPIIKEVCYKPVTFPKLLELVRKVLG
jgi:DNA-binding response OmpR family regulator